MTCIPLHHIIMTDLSYRAVNIDDMNQWMKVPVSRKVMKAAWTSNYIMSILENNFYWKGYTNSLKDLYCYPYSKLHVHVWES